MTYIMKMPASYVDVSKEEMEYDGGFVWALISGVAMKLGTIIGVVSGSTLGIYNQATQATKRLSGVIYSCGIVNPLDQCIAHA